MNYSDAVELTAKVQSFLNDDKNVFMRTAAVGNNFGVGIRRVSFEGDMLERLMFMTRTNMKSISIGPVDRERSPEDVFRPVVGTWNQECLIAIIY